MPSIDVNSNEFQLLVAVIGGGGLTLLLTSVASWLKRRTIENEPIKIEVLKNRIHAQMWRAHRYKDSWTAYGYNHGLLGSVLNYGLVLEFCVVNRRDEALVLTGLKVIEQIPSSLAAVYKQIPKKGLSPLKCSPNETQVAFYNSSLDFIFWDAECFLNFETNEVINNPHFVIPSKGLATIRYVSYRSFFDKRKLDRVPEEVIIQAVAGGKTINKNIPLVSHKREPQMMSFPEFTKAGLFPPRTDFF